MTTDTIFATVNAWKEDPGKAQVRPSVTARVDGSQAVIEAGPFSWRADLPAPLGGSNRAPSPTALLLGALAGCAVVFIRDTLAPLLNVRVTDVRATVRCQADFRGLLGLDGVPPDLERIALDIEIATDQDERDVQTLIQAWKDRCPIYLALIKPTAVATTVTVTRDHRGG